MTLRVIETLGKIFGYRINGKGFKVLPDYVRIIQGDGVNPKSIAAILQNYYDHGWSAENIAFGMGGALLQNVNRDTFGYAMKANAKEIDGVWYDVSKNPITDSNKKSKAGRQAVVCGEDGFLIAVREDSINGRKNWLVPVWRNGHLLKDWTFAEVRENTKIIY